MVASGEARTASLGQRLGAEEARALERGRAEGAEEDEALDARCLGGAQQPRRGEPVELLDRCARLVADRGREVDHGVDAAQRLAHEVAGRQLAEVAERDLHVDPLAAEPRGSRTRQRTSSPRSSSSGSSARSDASRCAGHEHHRRGL